MNGIFQLTLLLFTVALALLLAYLVYRSNPRSHTNTTFVIFIAFTLTWIISNFVGDHYPNRSNPRINLDVINVSSAILIWVLYYYSTIYPNKQTPKQLTVTNLVGIAPLLIITYLLVFTNQIVKAAIPSEQALGVEFGGLSPIFLLYFVGYLGASVKNFIKKFRNARGIERRQMQYLFLGLGITAVIAIVTNLVFPLAGQIEPSVYGPYSIFILLGFIAYSIIRHQLFEINLVIARAVLYIVLLSAVAISFVGATIIVGTLFQETLRNNIIVGIVTSIIIVFGLDPLKRWVSALTDRIFFKARIEYQHVLKSLTEIISTEIDIDKLIERLASNMTSQLKINNAVLMLKNEVTPDKHILFKTRTEDHPNTPVMEIDDDTALIRFLKGHHHATVLDALERRIEDTRDERQKKEMEESRSEFGRLGAAVIAPVEAQGQLNAILALGPKLSGDSYSNEDLDLVAVLGPQIGSAIEKAKLYERVKEFSESLQQKVEIATAELQERNVSLVTLQNITKEITRTLDFNRVAQRIANSIATELGYLGAILVLLDDDGHTSRARAITETPLTLRVIKLLPKHFSEYPSDLNDPKYNNMEAKALRTGIMQVTEHISDVVTPPLPRTLANTMQKMLGVKTIFVVPVVSEDKVIGAIEVGTKRERADIKDADLSTLQSVADELGVVARNIKLFDQIRSTNDKLAVANRHLQALDQAKSEFVSIASHQLRTPMTGIKGYLSMMVGGDFGAMKPEHTKILKDLLSESDRMIRLINLFLNVSKIEAGKFTVDLEPSSIEAIVEHEVKELAKEAQDKGLKLVYKRPAQPLSSINVDADKLQDVLLNLIDNAVKYTHAGSITVSLKESDDGITVAVKDTGIGIDPEEAKDLFNKFVRGSGIAQIHPDGSGLGLFIAKRIVEAHGGRIWVESTGRGKGSTFQFFLPKTAPQGRFEVGEEEVTAKPPLPANVAH